MEVSSSVSRWQSFGFQSLTGLNQRLQGSVPKYCNIRCSSISVESANKSSSLLAVPNDVFFTWDGTYHIGKSLYFWRLFKLFQQLDLWQKIAKLMSLTDQVCMKIDRTSVAACCAVCAIFKNEVWFCTGMCAWSINKADGFFDRRACSWSV